MQLSRCGTVPLLSAQVFIASMTFVEASNDSLRCSCKIYITNTKRATINIAMAEYFILFLNRKIKSIDIMILPTILSTLNERLLHGFRPLEHYSTCFLHCTKYLLSTQSGHFR